MQMKLSTVLCLVHFAEGCTPHATTPGPDPLQPKRFSTVALTSVQGQLHDFTDTALANAPDAKQAGCTTALCEPAIGPVPAGISTSIAADIA